MLPTPGLYRHRGGFIPDYLRRAIKYSQMDLENASWQMVTLCIDPKRVYKHTCFHKQTKNQWARDDPGFTVLCIFFLLVAAVAYTIAFRVTNPGAFIRLVLGAVCFDFLFVGALLATLTWAVANKYLRVRTLHSVEQKVEWLYAFDIHCNAFFPLFLMLYVLQFFLLPILLKGGFFATLVSNSLFLLAFGYYHYITFLGYQALPFLENSVYFLYPVALLLVGYIFSLIFNINCTVFALGLYFGS
uniref:UNC-50 family protein n=1 Tax=Hanusia phi TaxID=3032 RepID=A0A7S0NED4_9CRYP|mmetsp:Transcript_8357/g.18994  ORF Transcript_8357/g.18994 Transcript_8357/m.18994 type:complete len:244 (+) Transcript_8357:124-855(+)